MLPEFAIISLILAISEILLQCTNVDLSIEFSRDWNAQWPVSDQFFFSAIRSHFGLLDLISYKDCPKAVICSHDEMIYWETDNDGYPLIIYYECYNFIKEVRN